MVREPIVVQSNGDLGGEWRFVFGPAPLSTKCLWLRARSRPSRLPNHRSLGYPEAKWSYRSLGPDPSSQLRLVCGTLRPRNSRPKKKSNVVNVNPMGMPPRTTKFISRSLCVFRNGTRIEDYETTRRVPERIFKPCFGILQFCHELIVDVLPWKEERWRCPLCQKIFLHVPGLYLRVLAGPFGVLSALRGWLARFAVEPELIGRWHSM